MSSLFFVVPVHQRLELTELCLTQLRWTCDQLDSKHIRANAVVVGDDEPTLKVAKELGFWTVTQGNEPLGRKFNDGIDASHMAGAEYVVPMGSDNWVHPDWFTRLPKPDEVVCHRLCMVVRPDGLEGAHLLVKYPGGDGIRTFPTELFKPLGYRPAVDHRNRSIDTSIIERLNRFAGWKTNYLYHEWQRLQVIGFQSEDVQLNDYDDLWESFGTEKIANPWEALAAVYPPESVARMEQFFERRRELAA